jgi:uncharacterized protein DUF4845
MRNRQTGVTAIGWLFLLTPTVIVGYAAIRLAPVYLNYMKVAKAMETTASEAKDGASPTTIRNTLDKHFDIDMIEYPETKDMKITRDGAAWVLECAYSDDAPLIANVSLHVEFNKTVRIGGAAGGD